jgi:biopolymer transport protein ExbD
MPSGITVVVSTGKNGPSMGIVGSVVIQTREREIVIRNDGTCWEANLYDELKKLRNDIMVGDSDDIQIQAERRLKYDFVVRVMDACTRSGFKRVGFKSPPDLGVDH